MGWLIYTLFVLFTGVPAIFHFGWEIGMCGILSPLLAVFAGGGIGETIDEKWYEKCEHPWGTFIFGLVLISFSLFWVSYVGWHVQIFHHDLAGIDENLISAVLGLFRLQPFSPPMKISLLTATSADFSRAAHMHDRTFVLFLIITAAVWWRMGIWWAVIPTIMALVSGVKMIGARRVARTFRDHSVHGSVNEERAK